MASKKERLKKKQESRNKREKHKKAKRFSDVTGISFRNMKPRQIKRALDGVLAQAQNANQKAQKLIDRYTDENMIFYDLYNSIIHKILNVVNDLDPITKQYNTVEDLPAIPSTDDLKDIQYIEPQDISIINQFNDAHATDLTVETDWGVDELTNTHNGLIEYKEYLGLYSNSQFAQNYEKAGEVIDDAGTALDDLNAIIADEINTVPNDSETTLRLIKMEFETKAAEKFYSSDQARQMRVLHDYIHTDYGTADDEDYYNQL